MANVKKRSVAPIYAIALVWVIFALVHPLYRVSDYVSVILLSGLAFVVAKGIWPTVEYDLPDSEPEVPAEPTEEEPAEEAPAETPAIPSEEADEPLPEPEQKEHPPSPDTEP